MKLDGLTPMLWTEDLKATIAFYKDILGFEMDNYNEEWGWCHMHSGEVRVMFSVPFREAPYEGRSVFTGSFYIFVEDIDAAWENLRTKAKIGYEIANFSHGMREFAILDNNGYMLQFGRELKEGEAVTDCE